MGLGKGRLSLSMAVDRLWCPCQAFLFDSGHAGMALLMVWESSVGKYRPAHVFYFISSEVYYPRALSPIIANAMSMSRLVCVMYTDIACQRYCEMGPTCAV